MTTCQFTKHTLKLGASQFLLFQERQFLLFQ